MVLIPLSGLVWKTASLDGASLARAVLSPRALAAYRLSFGAALVAGSVNVVFGVLLAWVLTRYEFPGRDLDRRGRSICRSRCRRRWRGSR